MKPIHKFNNGIGATLCNKCMFIISMGFTDDIFCEKCTTKQHLIDMMKEDEELAMYEEAFKHEVRVIPKEEILDNRASAYEFINFDKQETLEEAFEKWSDLREGFGKLDVLRFGAEWQQERSYSDEEVENIANWAFGFCRRNDLSDDELENEFNRILAERFKKK